MRPHPRLADTDPQSPRAWATCQRCGFIVNHEKMQWQMDWRGRKPMNLMILVCPPCLDDMQRQLGVIILPPDPPAILNARVEPYSIDMEESILEDQANLNVPTGFVGVGFGNLLTDQAGNDLFSN